MITFFLSLLKAGTSNQQIQAFDDKEITLNVAIPEVNNSLTTDTIFDNNLSRKTIHISV